MRALFTRTLQDETGKIGLGADHLLGFCARSHEAPISAKLPPNLETWCKQETEKKRRNPEQVYAHDGKKHRNNEQREKEKRSIAIGCMIWEA